VPAVVMARRGETLAAAYMARAKEAGAAWSCLATPEAIRATTAEHLIALQFERRAIDRADADAAWRNALDGAGALTPLFDGVLRAVIFGLGGLAASYDHMTLGSLAAFLAIAALLDRPMQALIDALGAFEEIRQQLHRVDEIWDSHVTETKSLARPMLRGHIAFDRVTFRHCPTAAPVIEDVSFEIVPGQCVAIVGRSGAGKSTIVSLLLGILSPVEGRVLLDGHDLSELDIDAVRAQLGVVLQDGHIFARTVRENVALGDESLPLETITGAARLACIHDDMQALEQGYATKLGAGGVGLSGGQSQRLRLARAVAAGPKILVLDEATSSLDRPLEAAIQAGIDRLDCTRVVIAHRLATVQSADQILVMDRGRLVDRGTFDELAGRPGILREMLDVSFA
jgi:ATP-binding cassette subfamily B protein